MHARRDLTEIFSTFIAFQGDDFGRWSTDSTLRRSMREQLAHVRLDADAKASDSKHFWAAYWHKAWSLRRGRLETAHLLAYLQETCYWVAHKAARILNNSHYRLPDCFQLAIAYSESILAGFKPKRGASLESYARMALPTLLRDQLRQRREAYLCSNWALLRRLSQRQLMEALGQAGLSPAQIDQYCLAWNCYKAIHVTAQMTKTNQVQAPELGQWQAIADLYNTERLTQLSLPGSEKSPQILEDWLRKASIWTREYLYPPIVSLNAPKVGYESKEELQDDFSDGAHHSLLAVLIAEEEAHTQAAQIAQLMGVIERAVDALREDHRQVLRLYYQQDLTQQEIALKLGTKQYTVSRRLTRAKEQILIMIVQWGQERLHSSLTPDQVTLIGQALEEWLSLNYCSVSQPLPVNKNVQGVCL